MSSLIGKTSPLCCMRDARHVLVIASLLLPSSGLLIILTKEVSLRPCNKSNLDWFIVWNIVAGMCETDSHPASGNVGLKPTIGDIINICKAQWRRDLPFWLLVQVMLNLRCVAASVFHLPRDCCETVFRVRWLRKTPGPNPEGGTHVPSGAP